MEVYIASAARTPIGKFGGALKSVSPVDLGATAIKAAVSRAKIEPKQVEFTIMGNILRAAHGQDIARQAAVRAGIPMESDAYSVDMVCSSGMMSVINAVHMIKAGDADVVVAGGIESMSQSALAVRSEVRWGVKALIGRTFEFIDTMQVDGLTDPFNSKAMGIEADASAKSNSISRKELDEISVESHKRAAAASSGGMFTREIAPIMAEGKEVTADEGIRPDSNVEKLSTLKPAFGADGIHTAASASQLSDGAAAMVIMSEKAVKSMGIEPAARIVGHSWVGVENTKFVEAPVDAIRKLSQRAKLDLAKVDYFENNEAFAVSSALIKKHLGIPYERINAFGGALALGHPIGSSGARIMCTLVNVLSQRNGKIGVASLCHGTGGSTAMAIEKIKGI
jgi:acetyl-CoA C-acetyltransferase